MSKDTGGPAFPAIRNDGATTISLSGIPKPDSPYSTGMTMRDYFAAAALTGLVANKVNPMRFHPTDDARWVYGIADAMLKERAK